MRLTLATVSIIDPGCFSVLLDRNGWPLLVTCERTFDDIRPVIPAGLFVCKRRMYNHGGYMTHEVTGVDGHSAILFHKGNKETDSQACILTGSEFNTIDGVPAVTESGKAFDKDWTLMGQFEEFELEVIGR